MNRMLEKSLWAAGMALAVSAVHAEEATSDTWMTAARSLMSRAEVMGDLARTRLSGLFAAATAAGWSFQPMRRGTVTVRLADGTEVAEPEVTTSRADVIADLRQARQSGDLARWNAESHDFLSDRRAS